MPTTADNLLRIVRQTPETTITTPRVLGVDDWAKCRGQSYGTILVDLETHQVVDLLPERTADALTTWLKEHPGVEIISRDRSSEYSNGATTGAPHAEQVADRWHLLHNLWEALSRFLETAPACLRAAAEEPASVATVTDVLPSQEQQPQPAQVLPETQLFEPTIATTKAKSRQQARRAVKQARYEQVRALHQEGVSLNKIQQVMGMSYRTVVRYLDSPTCPFYPERVSRGGQLAPYLDYLEKQWDAGRHNATQLWREIGQQGFKGSRGLVAKWAAKKRPTSTSPRSQGAPDPVVQRKIPLVPWSVRQVTWLLFRINEDLNEDETRRLQQVLQVEPMVAKVYDFIHAFQDMVRNKHPEKLNPWLDSVLESGIDALVSFANGINRDFAAVYNALALPWSNGQTEGQVNRLKFIKRQMYGRAKFDLLRKKVLGYPVLEPAFT